VTPARQAAIGLSLAGFIVAGWATLHIYTVFFFPLEGSRLIAAPLLVALICWLNVGLFIVAHDCMHGSLAPERLGVNRWVGRIALALYAGFSFDRLLPKHLLHHCHPGTADDPDFSTGHPRHFGRWYLDFFRQYFGIRELVVLTIVVSVYMLLLGAPYPNLLLFWALPAILSSLQLFLFGTYLPHRAGEEEFGDHHRARSNEYGWLASFLTCFHFGYHHEHHLAPHAPWWRLPAQRTLRRGSPPPVRRRA
jgi:beta-carotene/zeaxanthin 4-ketolase